jgi:hypothetical protein
MAENLACNVWHASTSSASSFTSVGRTRCAVSATCVVLIVALLLLRGTLLRDRIQALR